MKKFLGILVLGLLWCNISFANKINLECSTPSGTRFKLGLDLENKTITNLFNNDVDNIIISNENKCLQYYSRIRQVAKIYK